MKVRKNETRTEAIRRFAVSLYDRATKLPEARRKIAAALGESPATVISITDATYYRTLGERNPLPASANRGPAALAAAVRKRRDGSDRAKLAEGTPPGLAGSLRRWDTLAASATAATGTKVSRADVEALYVRAGGDPEASYTGRGTRLGARKTYGANAATPAEVAVAKPKGRAKPSAAPKRAAKPKGKREAAKN